MKFFYNLLMILPFFRAGHAHYAASFIVLALICLPASSWAQTPFFDSTVSVGTTRGGETYVVATAADAQGNMYVLGSFIGTISLGNHTLISRNGNDPLIVKFDVAGNYLWSISPAGIHPNNLVVDANGSLYVTGSHTAEVQLGSSTLPTSLDRERGDVFVAKLDATGNWLWATSGGGFGRDYGSDLATNAAGAIAVVGVLSDTIATFGSLQLAANPSNSSSTEQNAFIARVSADGNWLGVKTVGKTTNFTKVVLDAAGNAYVCGTYTSASLQLGNTILTNAVPGTLEAYVAKLTPAGEWQWAVTTGGGSSKKATGIAVDNAGTTYFTGTFFGSIATFGATTLTNKSSAQDIFVAALDPQGEWRWVAQAGGADHDVSGDLTLDSRGWPVITGEFASRTAQFGTTELTNTGSTGKEEAFVAKLDVTGAWRWALSSTGSEDEIGQAIVTAPDGAACVVGSYWGEPTFGSVALKGNNVFPNVFLTKVYDNGPLASVAALAPSVAAPGQVVTLTGTGFVGVTAVLFNGAPAAAFAVQSSSRLEATVPSGATMGPVSVRTDAGAANSAVLFQPLALATATPAEAAALLAWPNPVGAAESLQVRLPETISSANPSRAELRNSLGQVVRRAQFSGRTTQVPMGNLSPGVYHLAVFPAGGAVLIRRIVVLN